MRVKQSITKLGKKLRICCPFLFCLGVRKEALHFFTASGQRQTYWKCSQLPEDTGMFWVKLILYSGLGSPSFPVILTHHISFGCISLSSLYPSTLCRVQFWELQWTGRFLVILPVHIICCWKGLELVKIGRHAILHELMAIAFISNGFKGHPSNANWIYITPVQWIGSHGKDFATNTSCSGAKLKAAVRNQSHVLQDMIQTQKKKMIPAWKIYNVKVSLGFMLSPDVAVGMCLYISFATWKKVASNYILR